jgi:uncharacterized protein YdhG (YjbR/CyaY superfamily)
MSDAPATVDAYLDLVEDPRQREALQNLRGLLSRLVPEAVETISYRIPSLRFEGKLLVGFGAGRNHCTFFLLSNTVLDGFAAELKGHKTGKGSIQFQPDSPLPEELVRRLVEARVAENRASRTSG